MLAAVPAIAVALFLVIEGGLVFALGLFVLGCICTHELYSMYDRAHPVRLAGFIALAGLLAAALYGSQFQILLKPQPDLKDATVFGTVTEGMLNLQGVKKDDVIKSVTVVSKRDHAYEPQPLKK